MNGKTVMVAMVAAGVLSGVALAQSGGKRAPGAHGAPGGEAMAGYLDLSPEQREQWKAMHGEHRKEAEPLRAQGRPLREKLRAALESEKPDPTAVGKAALAVKAHREKMKASSEAFRARLRAQLTPEQVQKFEAFEAARGFGGGEGRPRPGPGGPHHPPMGGPDGGSGLGPDEDDLPPPPIQG